ncbi:MAG TPA: ABC transporter transmembrane domain-containing protein, partial [Spirochaetota bacterium]|nr:ABC transporter transmembrane domain-containing protein [Spirochaetota bacterium]
MKNKRPDLNLLFDIQKLESNSSFLFEDSDFFSIVVEGKIDLFLTLIKDGEPVGHRDFFYSLSENSAIKGFRVTENNLDLTLIGVTRDGASIARVDKDKFNQLKNIDSDLLKEIIDNTITSLYGLIVKCKDHRKYKSLGDEEIITLEKNELFVVEEGVKWIKHIEGSSASVDTNEIVLKSGEKFFPVSRPLFFKSLDESKIQITETREVLNDDELYQKISRFLDRINGLFFKKINNKAEEEKKRILEKINQEDISLRTSLHSLSEVMNPKTFKENEVSEEVLIGCFRAVAKYLNVEVKIPQGNKITLESLAESSNLQMRQAVLKDKWQNSDNGILLGFLEKKNIPVALIPSPYGSYKIYNYLTGETEKATPKNTENLKSHAYTFYKPLPNKRLGIKDLIDYAFNGIWKFDMANLLLSGFTGGIISVVFPIMTGFLFNSIIPSAERNGLAYVGILLLVSICSGLIFQLTKIFTLLRIETKMDCSLQAAVWDRLINLPSVFFKNFTAGDLAQRANGISLIRRKLSGGTITSILSSFFSIFNLILLFFYSPGLAQIALLLVAASIVLTLSLGYISTFYQRKTVDTAGRISGLLLQIINGIAKFKVSGAEERAFALWAAEFSKKRKYEYKSDLL